MLTMQHASALQEVHYVLFLAQPKTIINLLNFNSQKIVQGTHILQSKIMLKSSQQSKHSRI
jgi:hypothetical protein